MFGHSGIWLPVALVAAALLALQVPASAGDDCVSTCINFGDGGRQHAGFQTDADYICCIPADEDNPPVIAARKCTGDDPAGAYQCSKYTIQLDAGELHSAYCWATSPPLPLFRCVDVNYTKSRWVGTCGFPGCFYVIDMNGMGQPIPATFYSKICANC